MSIQKTRRAVLAVGVLSALTLPPALSAAPPADARGFIYGKVTARGGSYEGRIRWNEEEAFWGDHFNSAKEERPYADLVPEDQQRRRQPIKVFGVTVGVTWEDDWGRQFVTRFGDIKKIEVGRGESAVVVLKSGTRQKVSGGSNDLGGTITIWDKGVGQVELDWKNLQSIEFLPVPAGLAVPSPRLHGTVHTEDGRFTGFIQWDQQECLGSDKLDGETRGGKLAIDMGNIRSIEKTARGTSRVLLKDGRDLVLDGTNDVNDENRGIFVENPRFGRALVTWKAFERLELSEPPGSGPAYGDFAPGRPLRGTVTDSSGKAYRGRIVYDVDESETSDFLDGDADGVTYSIPLGLVASIVPGKTGSTVRLASGGELRLEGAVDVNQDNAGLLIFEGDAKKPRYLAWSKVRRIDFER